MGKLLAALILLAAFALPATAKLLTVTFFPSTTVTATPTTLVTAVDIANGALTVAAWPAGLNEADLTVTIVDANNSMTACSLVIVGLSANNYYKTETINCDTGAGTTHLASAKVYGSVISMTLSGVAGAAAGDTIQVRTGASHYYVAAVESYGQLDGLVVKFEVTAATGSSGDHITLILQHSVDGVRWSAWTPSRDAFKSQLTGASSKTGLMYWTFGTDPSVLEESLDTGGFGDGGARYGGPVGNFWRVMYRISNTSGDPAAAPSFTFSVKATLWGVR